MLKEQHGAMMHEDEAQTRPLEPGDGVTPARPGLESFGSGQRIGDYVIRDTLGEGGFAVVYLAEQLAPVQRRVAFKVIKPGMDSRQVIARFEAERQALALMDHPSVARVYDAGSTEAGRLYFVMEAVSGVPVTEYCDRHRLSVNERLELFMQICEAVQHAHQKGIIHRDIKPSNVLVTARSGRPVAKVIDFGIAKALYQKLTERTVFTEQGQLIGTPDYMSPEQADTTAHDIDTRSDIYSLGVLLYVLLTGTLPFDPDSLRKGGFGGLQRVICEQDPPRPSTRLSGLGDESTTNAQRRRTDPRSLVRELRGDLDWIVMKALEKDRTRRYDTADALRADIRRHLDDEPVSAGPPHAAYRVRKFVRRNRLLVGATSAVALALLAGVIVSTFLYLEAKRASEQSAERFSEVRALAGSLLFDIHDQIKQLPGATSVREYLATTSLEYLDRLSRDAGNDPDLLGELADGYERLGEVRGMWTMGNLGDAGAALDSLRKARDIRQVLAEAEPDSIMAGLRLAHTHRMIADVLKSMGQTDESLESYRRELRVAEALSARAPENAEVLREVFVAHNQIGKLQVRMGNRSDALASYMKAEPIIEALAESHPDDPELQRDRAVLLSNTGKLQIALGRLDEAEKTVQRHLGIRTALADAHPANAQYRRDLAVALEYVGDLQLGAGEHEKAAETYGRCLRILSALVERDPDNMLYRRHISIAHEKMGDVRAAAGEMSAALVSYRESLAATRSWAEADPENADARSDLGFCHTNVARVHADLGQPGPAREHYAQSIEILEPVVESDPNNAFAHQTLTLALGRVGELDLKAGDTNQAIMMFEKRLLLTADMAERRAGEAWAMRDHRESLRKLGEAHERRADLEAARRRYVEALEVFEQMKAVNALGTEDADADRELHEAIARCE